MTDFEYRLSYLVTSSFHIVSFLTNSLTSPFFSIDGNGLVFPFLVDGVSWISSLIFDGFCLPSLCSDPSILLFDLIYMELPVLQLLRGVLWGFSYPVLDGKQSLSFFPIDIFQISFVSLGYICSISCFGEDGNQNSLFFLIWRKSVPVFTVGTPYVVISGVKWRALGQEPACSPHRWRILYLKAVVGRALQLDCVPYSPAWLVLRAQTII